MAEPNAQPQDESRKISPGTNGSGDELPDDPAELKRMLAEERRKTGQLLNDNKKAKSARDQMTERMKTWLKLEEEGHTPEEIQAILAKTQSEEVKAARESGDLDKMIKNATKVAEKQAEEERAKRQKAESLVQRVLVDDVLNRLLDKYVESKYKRAVFSMLRPMMETLEDADDEYGMRTVVRVGGDYMSADEFLRHWAETDDEAVPFLKASMAAGGGAAGGRGGDPRLRLKARKDMTPLEKSQFIRNHPGGPQQGLIEYNKLPWDRSA